MFLQLLSKIKHAQPLLKLPDTVSSLTTNWMSRSISSQINPAWRNAASYSCQLTSPLAPLNNHIISRNAHYAYRPNAAKRIMKHGLEKRLSSRSQREILFRRIVKGRRVLCVFPRFVNELPDLKNKSQKRVQLFSKDKGYKTISSGPEYYKFRE